MVEDFTYLYYLEPRDKNCNISYFIFVDFLAVKVDRSDVKPGICVTVNIHSYRHTEHTCISFDFELNRYCIYYLMKINRNSQIHGSFVC